MSDGGAARWHSFLVFAETCRAADTGERIAGGINLPMDITDRKNAEIEASEQFRAIIETTPKCVKIVAGDGKLLF